MKKYQYHGIITNIYLAASVLSQLAQNREAAITGWAISVVIACYHSYKRGKFKSLDQ